MNKNAFVVNGSAKRYNPYNLAARRGNSAVCDRVVL